MAPAYEKAGAEAGPCAAEAGPGRGGAGQRRGRAEAGPGRSGAGQRRGRAEAGPGKGGAWQRRGRAKAKPRWTTNETKDLLTIGHFEILYDEVALVTTHRECGCDDKLCA